MHRSFRFSLLSVLAILCFAGTANSATMYALDQSNDFVHAFGAASDGSLTSIAGSPFAIPGGGVTTWEMTSDGRHAFAGYLSPGQGGVRAFNVSETGAVTPAQDKISWALTNNQATALAVSPNDRFLYVATRHYPPTPPGPAGIRVFAINADGTLTEIAGSPFNTAYEYWDMAVTPDGSAMYAEFSASADRMALSSDGAIGPPTPNPTGTISVRSISMAPDGRFLYVSGNDSTNGAVASFAIGPTGTLSAVGTPVTWTGGSTTQASLSTDGRFLYVADKNGSSVHTVAIAPDGSLSLVGGGVPFDGLGVATVSPDGRNLYITTDGFNTMFRAPIGADGSPGPSAGSVPFNGGEDTRKTFRAGQGTVASLAATPAAKPFVMRFDSSKTTTPLGTVGTRTIDFGDGTVAQADAVSDHKYSKPGVYSVKLTAADDTGCAERFIYSGRGAICRGAASSVKTLKVDTPPWITSLKVSPSRVNSKTKIKFKLTESATVTFVVQRPTVGRTVNGSCKKQTAKNKKAKRCTRWVTVGKKFTAKGKAKKTNSVRFTGSVKGAKLPRGSYRFSATAKDKAKGVGPARTVRFKIKR